MRCSIRKGIRTASVLTSNMLAPEVQFATPTVIMHGRTFKQLHNYDSLAVAFYIRAWCAKMRTPSLLVERYALACWRFLTRLFAFFHVRNLRG